MLEQGFAPGSYDPDSRCLKTLNGKNHQAGNTSFVKDIEAVRRRYAALFGTKQDYALLNWKDHERWRC